MKYTKHEKRTTFHTYTVGDEKFTEIRTVVEKPHDDNGLNDVLKTMLVTSVSIFIVFLGFYIGITQSTAPDYQQKVNLIRGK